MKICILSTYSRFPFAQDLVMGAFDFKEILISYINETTENLRTKGALRNEIESHDVILAVIDKEFNDNEFLHSRLNMIVSMIRRGSKKILVPVILDDAEFPAILGRTACIECTSTLESSVENARLIMRKIIQNSQSVVKKKKLQKSIVHLFLDLLTILCGMMIYGMLEKVGVTFELDKVILFFCTAISIVFMLWNAVRSIRRQDDEEEIESYSRRLQRAIVSETIDQSKDDYTNGEDNKNEVIDALGRMLINLEDIKEFYTWSQKQAKQSFFLSVGLCILGFALIVASVVLIVVSNSGYEVAIVSTIGGVTTELIAGTALVVYKNSLSQLNHYHKALHEDERFLSSVNLLGKFSTIEAQDDMLREIIRSEIQINLAGVNDNKSQGTEKEKI